MWLLKGRKNMAHWKRVETDNVRMVFVCPECKEEKTRVIFNDPAFSGAYRPACYICDDSGVTCNFVGVEVKTAGKGEKK
jgi:hypothetical protein